MEQSLIAALSGIQSNQTYLDVIGNNVANANTAGYKAQSAVFTDLLAEQVAGAAAPVAGQTGGVNPIAVGAGVRVGAVSTDQSQGSFEQTNQPSDVAIQGNGFLVTVQNGQVLYTRAGHLSTDANGQLVTPTGGLVEGWPANGSGTINPNAPIGPLTIPTDAVIPAVATSTLSVGGNLPAWDGTGTPPTETTTVTAYDSLGNTVPVTLTFTGTAGTANSWSLQGTIKEPDGTTTALWSTPQTITFDPGSGQVTAVGTATAGANGSFSLPISPLPATSYNFASGAGWSVDFPAAGAAGALTQFAGTQTLQSSANGEATGSLTGYSIGSGGVITGTFSNGRSQALGQLALASFANPGGLADQGNLAFAATGNSGQAQVGIPGTGGRGTLVAGSLEQSNVNLAQQLTDLIVAQEAYQANTKVVSTTASNLAALMQVA